MTAPTKALKEHPILFSGEMVKAILDERKTQTRRLIKPQPYWRERDLNSLSAAGWHWADGHSELSHWHEEQAFASALSRFCPYGQVGSALWVRETHYRFGHWNKNGLTKIGKQKWTFKVENREVKYFDNAPEKVERGKMAHGWFKRPSIFMPRWASRITLEITGIRVERVQDISTEDCIAEGLSSTLREYDAEVDLKHKYRALWDSINAKRGYSWESNPRVWIIEFKRVQL